MPTGGVAARVARRLGPIRQEGKESSEGIKQKVTYETHDVLAVFGAAADTGKPEVWLGVRCTLKKTNKSRDKVQMQFLEKMPQDDTYVLLTSANIYDKTQVEHTFKNVRFRTTVTKTVRKRKRSRRASTRTDKETKTVAPIDASILAGLWAKVQKEHEEQKS